MRPNNDNYRNIEIIGKRVIIRNFGDIVWKHKATDVLTELYKNSTVMKYFSAGHGTTNEKEITKHIDKITNGHEMKQFTWWAVTALSGELFGFVALIFQGIGEDTPKISDFTTTCISLLGGKYRNRGFMHEAFFYLFKYYWENKEFYGLTGNQWRIWSNIHPKNERAKKLRDSFFSNGDSPQFENKKLPSGAIKNIYVDLILFKDDVEETTKIKTLKKILGPFNELNYSESFYEEIKFSNTNEIALDDFRVSRKKLTNGITLITSKNLRMITISYLDENNFVVPQNKNQKEMKNSVHYEKSSHPDLDKKKHNFFEIKDKSIKLDLYPILKSKNDSFSKILIESIDDNQNLHEKLVENIPFVFIRKKRKRNEEIHDLPGIEYEYLFDDKIEEAEYTNLSNKEIQNMFDDFFQ